MKMIIEIDEKVYNDIKKSETYDSFYKASLEAVNAMVNGTIFSKEHGDLIDINEVLGTLEHCIKNCCLDKNYAEILKDTIKEIQPIIKGNISEEKKFQEFLYNNNISSDRHVKCNFEDGKLITLKISCCEIKGAISFEDFPNLKVLDLAYNDITDIDLTKNLNLKTLYLQNNNLTDIDLTKNRNLEYLELGYNELTNIDLTKNSKLEELYLPFNKLTNIDLTQNLELKKLNLEDNNLTVVDLRHNPVLYDVGIDPKTEIKITGDALDRIAGY